MSSKQRLVGVLVCILAFVVPAMAQMTIDGDISDWSGKLLNGTTPPRAGYLDVVQWGAYIEGGTLYFAQVFEYDMVNEFNGSGEGAWMNMWINADNNTSTGQGGSQITSAPWGTAGGIDIGIEIGQYANAGGMTGIPGYELYFTTGDDGAPDGDNYRTCSGLFSFSADGTFVEGSVLVSDVISNAAYYSQNGISEAFGVFDETAAAAAAAAGNWSVGTRIDGKDVSLGIGYGADFAGLNTTPTPEPATMVALTMAGLALIRRRRNNK